MSDRVGEWLEQLGLGQYAEAFAANAIDEHILPDLTDDDLKELGVVALGHRKAMLKSLASFSGSRRAAAEAAGGGEGASEPPPAGGPVAGIAAWERHPGERKPVTMLFADITGSTALTEKLDAEETHDLLYSATQRMCEAVESNRGTVCRFMGDGVMAMFGAPVASEHHAVDACLAALEMQRVIGAYASEIGSGRGSGLRIRVGLHSGEVVVLTVGEGGKTEYDASGPTVPIAARMEQAAPPGGVYITGATRSLAGDRVEARPLEPVRVKGVSEPLEVFALQRVRSIEEVAPGRGRTRFVGRRAELNQFRSMLDTCIDEGHGQTVYVRGEPGIGKTRLVEEFARIAAARGAACHRGLVLDFGAGGGQDAIRALVGSLLDIGIGGGEGAARTAVASAVDGGLIDTEQVPYLNDLLDVPQPAEVRALYDAMDSATRSERKQAVVCGLVTRLSGVTPLLIIVEDVHWAEPLTLAYLAMLSRTVAQCPALMVATARAESDPLGQAWRSGTAGSPFTTIDLGPLRKQDSIELIGGFIDASDPLAIDCLNRASGNPLFLEQLLHNAREGSVASVPDSIQSLVLARLDRLPPGDKRALQAASVLGQRFETEALCHLLQARRFDCSQLVGHNLVRPDGEGYLFAHALIREGVYGSLLKRQREDLHRRAAAWYSGRDLPLHAEHLGSANDRGAPGAFLAAARDQADRYHFERALDLTERGLAHAAAQPDRHALTCLKGELLRDLGNVQSSIAVYQEALDGALDDVQRCDAWMGLAAGKRVATDYAEALSLLDRAEAAAKTHRLTLELARLHHLRGNLCFSLGRADRCRDEHLLALEFAEQSESVEAQMRALGGLGDAEYARGHMKTARDYYARCIDLSREHGFGRIEVAHLGQRGFTRLYTGDWRGARREGLTAVDLARRIGDRRVEMNASGCVCHSVIDLGEYDVLEEHAERQLALARALGARTWEPLALTWKALVLRARGRKSEALDLLTRAASTTREVGRAFNGGRIFGALALMQAEDAVAREAALEQGENALREGSVGHNYLWFYRLAMDAMICAGDWERVERYAAALEDYTRSEPLAWCAFFIDRGRALARFGRGDRSEATVREIVRLRNAAAEAGLELASKALEDALASG